MIVILGAEGQLGEDLKRALAHRGVTALAHGEADVTDADGVSRVLTRLAPTWVINSAAVTNVDACESDGQRAFEVNAVGAGNVATACRSTGARLVHISTDYVFDGGKEAPYTETDATRPINAYGISKLSGELYVRYMHDAHYIVRTSGLYGLSPCRGKGGRNFVDTMIHLAGERDVLRIVDDEVLTPTFTEDVATQLDRLIDEAPPYGIYHVTNGGACSWFDFAEEIFRLEGIDVRLERTCAADWGAPARRPSFSVLANEALAALGLDSMPHWKDALSRYLEKRRASRRR